MKFKGLLCIMIGLAQWAEAQERMDKIARPGERGVYVFNANPMCSKEVPDKEGGVRIAIQRKDYGQGNWKTIGYFEAPANLFDLSVKYKKWSPYVLDRNFLTPQWIAGCWEKLEKTRNYDSTDYYAADQVMMFSTGRLFLDTTVAKGQKYEYQFARITASGESKVLGLSTVINYPETSLLPQPKLLKKEAEQDLVKITWYLKKSKKPAFFKVYRRTAGVGNTWENIVPVRSIFMVKPDTIQLVMQDMEVAANQNYDYFIKLSDSFGNYAPNSDTASLVSYKYQDISMPYGFRTKSLDSLKAIELRWNVIDKHLMAGIEVYRSKEYDGEYKLIGRVSVNDTTFRDRDVEPMFTYYYYLRAVDQIGRQSVKSVRAYGNLTDASKPMTPAKVIAQITPKGTKISWVKRGLFIEDFYVYRGIGIEGKMQKITSLYHCKDSACSFIDTTSRLNPKYQYGYAVSQVSTSHQESELSTIVYIQPKASVITILAPPSNLTAQKAGPKIVLLFWDDITLFHPEVSGYDVYKKVGNQAEFTKLTRFPLSTSQNHFKDTTYSQDQSAEYYVKSVDQTGKTSKPSSTITIKNEALIPIAPVNISASQMMSEKSVQLSWSNPKGNNLKTLKLFKAEQKKGSEPKLLAQLEPNQESYLDKDVLLEKSYLYYLIAVSRDGKESERSKVVFIQMINP